MKPRRVLQVLLLVVGCSAFTSAQATARPAVAGWSGSVTADRTYLDASGKTHPMDTRHIKLEVSQTADLRGRQEITVSWSGAHPTGGTVADVNSGDAVNEEYPFVLLECRGVVGATGANQVRPETCWTQTAAERFQKDNSTGYPAWRSDRYATTAQRAASVEAPTTRPAGCGRAGLAERWVPFDAANGTAYYGGSFGCAGMAPESANVGGAGIPSNATYGVTGTDGKGSADFDVWTADENASLGCSSSVPCALVAVPVMGVSCDAYGTQLPSAAQPPANRVDQADAACRATGQYAPGQASDPTVLSDAAVSGALWWSPSNWRNRLIVPLTFATPASICAVVSNRAPVAIYGSVLMTELSAQWQPTFCTSSSLYPFVHVQTSDDAARNLLNTGNINAAFTSRPPSSGFQRPTVQAPVAITGFAISYAIDDDHGNRYGSLRLDARLIAKLLTESYPANSLVRDNYPALAHNPTNLTLDPEFQALNPDLPHYNATEAAATLSSISGDADLMWALTSYLNADKEARAWLNGQPDPWGMTVNPNYLGISLPVQSWPLLDNFTLPASYINSNVNPCYTYSPAPYLQLIANPTALLSTIVQNIQFAVSDVHIDCPNGIPGDIPTLRLQAQGRQPVGHRFVLGLTSLSAARRYDLSTAALQSSLSSPDLAAKFADASGRQFVAPQDSSLRAAAALLEPDTTQHTWTLSRTVLSRTVGAYPGTMPVYADVPTVGLRAATAQHLAQFLRYAAKGGEVAGTANGQLPAGYLPLTTTNGLAKVVDYAQRAATAVAAQRGVVPPLTAPAPPPGGTPGMSGGSGVPSVPVLPPPAVRAPRAPSGAPTGTSSPTSAPTRSGDQPAGVIGVRAAASYSRLGSWLLPIVLIVGALGALAGPALRYPQRRRAATLAIRTAAKRVLRR